MAEVEAREVAMREAEARIAAANSGQSGGGRVAMINAAIDLFNEKPKKGVAELVRLGCAKMTEQSVAELLLRTPRFDKTPVGEYLGEFAGFNQGVLRCFVKSFDFAALGFDDALRLYLSAFRLPGEAQKIDRFMDTFAREYCRCNPEVFTQTDTAYTLAFSVIMLNTDHFNPNIREDRKMGRSEFISINRGVDKSLTESFLGVVFDRITSNEIIMNVHDTHDTGSCMLYTNPAMHGYLDKQGPQMLFRASWKRRWFVLKNQMLYYLKGPPALGKAPDLKGFIPLNEGLEVSSAAADFPGGDDHYDGKALVLFNRKAGKVKSCKIEPGHGMVQSSHSLFLLVAPDTAERDTWLAAIRRQIAHHEERASFQRPATHSLQPDATMTVLPTPDLDKLRGKLQSVGDASLLVRVENHTDQSLCLKRAERGTSGQWVVTPPQEVPSHCERGFGGASKRVGGAGSLPAVATTEA